jgi:hypothetical protein
MRYLFLLLIVPFVMLACKKGEQAKVRPGLPVFTCDDAADDGRYEVWDSSERAFIFPSGTATTYTIRDTMAVGYIKQMQQLSPNVSIGAPEFPLNVIYDSGRNWFWKFILVDNITGEREAFGSIMRLSRFEKDTVQEHVMLKSPPDVRITRGCKRLYYFGAIQTYHNSNNQAQNTNDINLDILFKGHFDVWAM